MNRMYARHWESLYVRVRVLLTLKRLDDAQPAAIAKVLGISRLLASYHLRCLEKAGRVRRHGASYRVVSGRRRPVPGNDRLRSGFSSAIRPSTGSSRSTRSRLRLGPSARELGALKLKMWCTRR